MAPEARKLIAEALKLPVRERAELVVEILSTLDSEREDDGDAADTAWREEVRRRLAEIDAGRVEPLSWEAARRLIDADE
jgi:putative addiction module component (TIGR02574 family)